MPNTSMFDRGASNTFFDPAIFDTAVHFTSSLTETIPVSDGLNRTLTAFRTITESSINVNDSINKGVFSNIPESSISVSDSLTEVQSLSRVINESVSVSDGLDRTLMAIRNINEFGHQLFDNVMFDPTIFDTVLYSINVSDSLSRTQSLHQTIVEPTISVSDNLDRTQFLARVINEATILVNDAIDRTASFARSIVESAISVADNVARQTSNFRTLVENVSVSDGLTLQRIFNRVLAEVITVADIVSGTLPLGSFRIISRVKEALNLISRAKEVLNIISRVI